MDGTFDNARTLEAVQMDNPLEEALRLQSIAAALIAETEAGGSGPDLERRMADFADQRLALAHMPISTALDAVAAAHGLQQMGLVMVTNPDQREAVAAIGAAFLSSLDQFLAFHERTLGMSREELGLRLDYSHRI